MAHFISIFSLIFVFILSRLKPQEIIFGENNSRHTLRATFYDKTAKMASKIKRFTILLVLFSHYLTFILGQNDLNLQLEAEIPMACANLPMTMIHDQMERPYIYVAQKEAGLSIYNISNINSPIFTTDISSTQLGNLHAMSLTQKGNYLYVVLGDFFATTESPGLAIVDITLPDAPVVLDVWAYSISTEGAGFVEISGDYAYLAAMGHGLIILDISDKTNIIYTSTFTPSIAFPDANPDPLKFNARGLAVKDDIVYLVYDAGGLRIINVSDKSMPVQTGEYSNPVITGIPRAYNNIILDDSLLYITLDYCGLEILNIADTSNISQLGWWNPWGCPTNNWFASEGHTNEIAFDNTCHIVFMSTGRSEMFAVDVSDPSSPETTDYFGSTSNNLGTWGVSQFDNTILLSYICTFGIPFPGNWPGVKILSYENPCSTDTEDEKWQKKTSIYPNPAHESISFELGKNDIRNTTIEILNISGQSVLYKSIDQQKSTHSIEHLAKGIYFIKISAPFQNEIFKLIIQ